MEPKHKNSKKLEVLECSDEVAEVISIGAVAFDL
jgi:hypothetical protein